MSKAQTDIRTTSYDGATANPFGYIGTIEDVLAQIRSEADIKPTINARAELIMFLGADKIPSAGPSTADDEGVWYGAPDVPKQPWDGLSPWSLEYAMLRWPQSFKQ